jgi:hypothetical protein
VSLAEVLRARLQDRLDRRLAAQDFEARLALLEPERVALLYEEAFTEAARRTAGVEKNATISSAQLAEHSTNG